MTIGLPKKGRAWSDLREEMTERASGDVKWRDAKTAVYVFNAGDDVRDVAKHAYAAFMSENGLGPAAFPSLKQMEDEVVSIGLDLLNGPEGAAGNITSGGTDSITMAIKAARDYARSIGKAKTKANIVVPWSAHPAFTKASMMMDLEERRVPCKDLYADPAAMAELIDENTIMIVGSAPCFPYGLIDPIAELGAVAAEKDVWLHVDACVGGYFAPFARMNGVDLVPFDFEVEAVKSISADLHKYGYCAKGASTVFFRTEALRAHMIFECADWPGGHMVTPTLAGTRPGGAISAAWAVMHYLGEEGYRAKQQQVCDTRQYIGDAAQAMGFEILGEPKLGLIAFHHPQYDSYALLGKMMAKGWITAVSTEPKALHLMLSPAHWDVKEQYVADLKAAMDEVGDGKAAEGFKAKYS